MLELDQILENLDWEIQRNQTAGVHELEGLCTFQGSCVTEEESIYTEACVCGSMCMSQTDYLRILVLERFQSTLTGVPIEYPPLRLQCTPVLSGTLSNCIQACSNKHTVGNIVLRKQSSDLKALWQEVRPNYIWILSLSFSGYVILGKLLSLSELQFPHLMRLITFLHKISQGIIQNKECKILRVVHGIELMIKKWLFYYIYTSIVLYLYLYWHLIITKFAQL